MTISLLLLSLKFGFGVTVLSTIIFFLGHFMFGKVVKKIREWANPWKDLESAITKY